MSEITECHGKLGNPDHQRVADELGKVFEASGFGAWHREYREGDYIYDVYFPDHDLVIEVGQNKKTKLNWLLKNKNQFIVAWPRERRYSFRLMDWLSRNRHDEPAKYIIPSGTQSHYFWLVSRHQIPGAKREIGRAHV